MHRAASNVSAWNSCRPTSGARWAPTLPSSHLCGTFSSPPQTKLGTPFLTLASCAPWHVPATLNPNGSWVPVYFSQWPMSFLRLGSPSHVAIFQAHYTQNRCLINVGSKSQSAGAYVFTWFFYLGHQNIDCNFPWILSVQIYFLKYLKCLFHLGLYKYTPKKGIYWKYCHWE